MSEILQEHQEMGPISGSTPEQAILLSAEELDKMRIGDEPNLDLLASGEPRVYVESEEIRSFIDKDGKEVSYNVWGVVTDPSDYGTRDESMGLFLRTENDTELSEVVAPRSR